MASGFTSGFIENASATTSAHGAAAVVPVPSQFHCGVKALSCSVSGGSRRTCLNLWLLASATGTVPTQSSADWRAHFNFNGVDFKGSVTARAFGHAACRGARTVH